MLGTWCGASRWAGDRGLSAELPVWMLSCEAAGVHVSIAICIHCYLPEVRHSGGM